MPYNGAGVFQLVPGNPVVTGTTISSTVHNNTMSDIANNGLTLAITKDGQQNPTANLPMAGFRHTGVGNGVARNDYAALGQAQDSVGQTLTGIAGTDTITATVVPLITAYATGQTFNFIPAGSNTTSTVTLNIGGLGAKNITKNGTQPLAPGDLVSSVAAKVYYDGTQFQLQTAPGTSISTQESSVKRLFAQNNGGTSTSLMDLSAYSVTLRGSSSNPSVTRFSVATITNNIGLSGPAANGRDQVAAFTTTAEVHFYFIWNGTTLATISSLSAPPAGPTLPTGYTHWAYAMSVRLNGTNLPQIRAFGRRVTYVTAQSLGTPNASTSFTYAQFVPSVAESFTWTGAVSLLADGSGGAYASLGIDSGITNQRVIEIGLTGLVPGAATGPFYARWVDMPNISGQTFTVAIVLSNGSSLATAQLVVDYTVPNY